MTKLKAFTDDKLNVDKMTIFLLDRVENTEGKIENACYQHFLLGGGGVKSQDCVVKS